MPFLRCKTKLLLLCPQDQVEVEVVRLTAIRIRAPITRMKTGAQVLFRNKQQFYVYSLDLITTA